MKIQKTFFSSYLFANIWSNLTGKLSVSELSKAGFIAKFIWDKRNEVVHLKPFTNPNALIQKVRLVFSIFGGTLDQNSSASREF